MIVEHIVEQHAENAAFLWQLRDLATGRPHYDLTSLRRLDERIEAHLDGLRIAGDAGWEIAKSALANGETGEMFVAALLAVERNDLQGIAHVLDASDGEAGLSRGIISALGWATFETVEQILPGLLSPICPPPLQYLGIGACAVHRVDPGAALTRALQSDDLRLRCRAVDAVGELGRMDLRHQVERDLSATDDELRFRAGTSAALLGSTHAAEVLWQLAQEGGRRAERAFSMAVRRAGMRIAREWIEGLGSRPEGVRTAIIGAGALGDPTLVPWLLQCMETPELARVAGEAYVMMTGVDFDDAKLEGKAPEGFDAGPSEEAEDVDVELDPDEDLSWPNVEAVRLHWEKTASKLEAGTRHLLGKPMSSSWLVEVLRKGGQRQRAAAAIEMALMAPGKPLFEVRAPGLRQSV